jgi:hypothetical protein
MSVGLDLLENDVMIKGSLFGTFSNWPKLVICALKKRHTINIDLQHENKIIGYEFIVVSRLIYYTRSNPKVIVFSSTFLNNGVFGFRFFSKCVDHWVS